MRMEIGSSSITMTCIVLLVMRRLCLPAGVSASSSMLNPTIALVMPPNITAMCIQER